MSEEQNLDRFIKSVQSATMITEGDFKKNYPLLEADMILNPKQKNSNMIGLAAMIYKDGDDLTTKTAKKHDKEINSQTSKSVYDSISNIMTEIMIKVAVPTNASKQEAKAVKLKMNIQAKDILRDDNLKNQNRTKNISEMLLKLNKNNISNLDILQLSNVIEAGLDVFREAKSFLKLGSSVPNASFIEVKQEELEENKKYYVIEESPEKTRYFDSEKISIGDEKSNKKNYFYDAFDEKFYKSSEMNLGKEERFVSKLLHKIKEKQGLGAKTIGYLTDTLMYKQKIGKLTPVFYDDIEEVSNKLAAKLQERKTYGTVIRQAINLSSGKISVKEASVQAAVDSLLAETPKFTAVSANRFDQKTTDLQQKAGQLMKEKSSKEKIYSMFEQDVGQEVNSSIKKIAAIKSLPAQALSGFYTDVAITDSVMQAVRSGFDSHFAKLRREWFTPIIGRDPEIMSAQKENALKTKISELLFVTKKDREELGLPKSNNMSVCDTAGEQMNYFLYRKLGLKKSEIKLDKELDKASRRIISEIIAKNDGNITPQHMDSYWSKIEPMMQEKYPSSASFSLDEKSKITGLVVDVFSQRKDMFAMMSFPKEGVTPEQLGVEEAGGVVINQDGRSYLLGDNAKYYDISEISLDKEMVAKSYLNCFVEMFRNSEAKTAMPHKTSVELIDKLVAKNIIANSSDLQGQEVSKIDYSKLDKLELQKLMDDTMYSAKIEQKLFLKKGSLRQNLRQTKAVRQDMVDNSSNQIMELIHNKLVTNNDSLKIADDQLDDKLKEVMSFVESKLKPGRLARMSPFRRRVDIEGVASAAIDEWKKNNTDIYQDPEKLSDRAQEIKEALFGDDDSVSESSISEVVSKNNTPEDLSFLAKQLLKLEKKDSENTVVKLWQEMPEKDKALISNKFDDVFKGRYEDTIDKSKHYSNIFFQELQEILEKEEKHPKNLEQSFQRFKNELIISDKYKQMSVALNSCYMMSNMMRHHKGVIMPFRNIFTPQYLSTVDDSIESFSKKLAKTVKEIPEETISESQRVKLDALQKMVETESEALKSLYSYDQKNVIEGKIEPLFVSTKDMLAIESSKFTTALESLYIEKEDNLVQLRSLYAKGEFESKEGFIAYLEKEQFSEIISDSGFRLNGKTYKNLETQPLADGKGAIPVEKIEISEDALKWLSGKRIMNEAIKNSIDLFDPDKKSGLIDNEIQDGILNRLLTEGFTLSGEFAKIEEANDQKLTTEEGKVLKEIAKENIAKHFGLIDKNGEIRYFSDDSKVPYLDRTKLSEEGFKAFSLGLKGDMLKYEKQVVFRDVCAKVGENIKISSSAIDAIHSKLVETHLNLTSIEEVDEIKQNKDVIVNILSQEIALDRNQNKLRMRGVRGKVPTYVIDSAAEKWQSVPQGLRHHLPKDVAAEFDKMSESKQQLFKDAHQEVWQALEQNPKYMKAALKVQNLGGADRVLTNYFVSLDEASIEQNKSAIVEDVAKFAVMQTKHIDSLEVMEASVRSYNNSKIKADEIAPPENEASVSRSGSSKASYNQLSDNEASVDEPSRSSKAENNVAREGGNEKVVSFFLTEDELIKQAGKKSSKEIEATIKGAKEAFASVKASPKKERPRVPSFAPIKEDADKAVGIKEAAKAAISQSIKIELVPEANKSEPLTKQAETEPYVDLAEKIYKHIIKANPKLEKKSEKNKGILVRVAKESMGNLAYIYEGLSPNMQQKFAESIADSSKGHVDRWSGALKEDKVKDVMNEGYSELYDFVGQGRADKSKLDLDKLKSISENIKPPGITSQGVKSSRMVGGKNTKIVVKGRNA